MSDANLSNIVREAYAAAFDETLWAGWLQNVTQALGGVGGTFFILDAENSMIENIVTVWGKAADVTREYFEGWWEFDPQLPTALSLSRSGIYLDTDHVNLGDLQTADYMSWQRDKGGFDHHMSAVALFAGGQRRAGISIHRSTAQGFTPKHEQEKLAAIFPEVASAMQLGYRHNELLQDAFWDGLSVGRDDKLAYLLDQQGRVIRHTDAAEKMLMRKDGLDIVQLRLNACRPIDNGLLQALIARASARQSPRSGSMRISRESGKPPLILICYPIPHSSRMFAPAEAATLVIVIDPFLRARRPGELYGQAFDLTPRETEMAVAIMQGHSVESAASFLGIGMPTARTYLRNLYDKTAANTLPALIRLLSKIG